MSCARHDLGGREWCVDVSAAGDSGRRRYAPIPAPEIGVLWRSLFVALEDFGLGADSVTLGVGKENEAVYESSITGGLKAPNSGCSLCTIKMRRVI